MNVISALEFIVLAEKHDRAYKYGKVLVYCEACLKPHPTQSVPCLHCGGKGMKVVTLPILLEQKMPPDDFEFLKLAIRLGEQYG